MNKIKTARQDQIGAGTLTAITGSFVTPDTQRRHVEVTLTTNDHATGAVVMTVIQLTPDSARALAADIARAAFEAK